MRPCLEWKKILSLARVLLLLGLGMIVPACGTPSNSTIDTSPPVDIPPPISNLMTVSGPDADGQVRITGSRGAVLNGALVQVTDLTQGGMARLEAYFLASAFAQETPIDVIANPDGSFQLTLRAKIGDILRVVQIVNGHASPPVDLVVTGKSLLLDIVPKDLKLQQAQGVAFIVGPEGDHGVVLQLALDPLPGSFPELVADLPGFSGITQFVLEDEKGFGLATSTSDNGLYRVALDHSSPPIFTAVPAPLGLAVSEDGDWAVLGSDAGSPSLFIYDGEENKIVCSLNLKDPNHPDLVALRSPNVAMLPAVPGPFLRFVVLTQFSDSSWLLSALRVHLGNCTLEEESNVSLQLSQPGDLALSNDGSVAWLSDTGSDRVFRTDLKSLDIEGIAVGKAPLGLALSEDLATLWVVNQLANSITAINTQDLSTRTLSGIGMSPSRIAVDADHSRALVLSTLDQSVVLVDLPF